VWEIFQQDTYHSPKVVWGREVNLLSLGLVRQMSGCLTDPCRVRLQRLLDRTRSAVAASGVGYNELWSYRIDGRSLKPVRYGSGSDVQLWSTTDLAVRYTLSLLPPRQ